MQILLKYSENYGCDMTKCEKVHEAWMLLQGMHFES